METTQQGKGFIPILVLVVVAALVAVLFISQGNFMTKTNVVPGTGTDVTATPQSSGTVEVMLDPTEVNVTAGKTFTINVKVDTKTDTVTAADLHLSYDPDYLEAIEIKADAFLPVVLTPGKVTTNTASIVIGANPTTPQKGMGTLAVVTFKAKKTGMTEIKVDKMTQVAAIGKKGSVLGTTKDASVIIK